MLGQLDPSEGSVRLGTNLEIAYFDQLRAQLDEDATVQDNIGGGNETITIEGRSKHVIGYLQDFLFTPERARTQVRFLSGGERNRVLLARLFAKPANVIVLDEPTNDLDTETLELLEEKLVEFTGTILLVSHDRAFLNNVVTSTIVFETAGVKEYDGGYDDWQRQRQDNPPQESAKKKSSAPSAPPPPKQNKKKLSYKEQQELKSLPGEIETLEASAAALHQAMAEPDYYKQPSEVIASKQAELTTIEQRLATAYTRWEELEQIAE